MREYKLSSSAQSDLINIRRYTLEHWGETQWASYFMTINPFRLTGIVDEKFLHKTNNHILNSDIVQMLDLGRLFRN